MRAQPQSSSITVTTTKMIPKNMDHDLRMNSMTFYTRTPSLSFSSAPSHHEFQSNRCCKHSVREYPALVKCRSDAFTSFLQFRLQYSSLGTCPVLVLREHQPTHPCSPALLRFRPDVPEGGEIHMERAISTIDSPLHRMPLRTSGQCAVSSRHCTQIRLNGVFRHLFNGSF